MIEINPLDGFLWSSPDERPLFVYLAPFSFGFPHSSPWLHWSLTLDEEGLGKIP